MKALNGLLCAFVWGCLLAAVFGETEVLAMSEDTLFLSLALAYAGGCAGGGNR